VAFCKGLKGKCMEKHYPPGILFFIMLFTASCWIGCSAAHKKKTGTNLSGSNIVISNTTAAQKKSDIKKLIKISGNIDSLLRLPATHFGNQMTLLIRRLGPDLSKQTVEKLRQDLFNEIEKNIQEPGGLLDYIISIYDNHFTHQEIKDWLFFYESPLGKKINSTQPSLMKESSLAYQEWSRNINPFLYDWMKVRLKKEGISLP